MLREMTHCTSFNNKESALPEVVSLQFELQRGKGVANVTKGEKTETKQNRSIKDVLAKCSLSAQSRINLIFNSLTQQ